MEQRSGQDYLWDKSGGADPEVERLERALTNLQYQPRELVFPAILPEKQNTRPRVGWLSLAFAASLVLLLSITALVVHLRWPTVTSDAAWQVSRTEGTPLVGGVELRGHLPGHLNNGEALETDAHSSASLRADHVGEINVEPGTRLLVLSTEAKRKWVKLDRGTIRAYIWAPAGEFVVQTPSATTVDLGCAYTLHIDENGSGTVRTSMGWVGFKSNGREAFIPAGATCSTRPKAGPGTPHFEDAPEALQAALARIDFEETNPKQLEADLAIVLNTARPRDALTLWHLFSRVEKADRARVFDRLNTFVPAPAGVTKQGIQHLNQAMLDAWWNQLGFDDISVWRTWERSWGAQLNKN